ncbi:hypothetical protein FHS79_002043 [Polymorphobacter multimanifer]|uniref:Uncharacterized protein n=1 Tax=Polymorphobacter multimanifer TaxID=1070431 RepID=A0A841LFC4_9SPHN|nr:DUF6491 family protein [Polymorphobacter multimanifer]MBB6227862.1 hypothetical protein [Polymorphobacter multimanifer]
MAVPARRMMAMGVPAVALALLASALAPALAQRPSARSSFQAERGRPAPQPAESFDVLSPWERMNVEPGAPLNVRPEPPTEGRKTCIRVDGIAGAQMFGDTAIELTMRNGQHWRLFLANQCPGLSFYQGFYYRRGKAGMLCAGRDTIGARSGGECAIASIVRIAGN